MGKKPRAEKPKSTQHELIQCDLEFPPLQATIAFLEVEELEQVLNSVDKISKMTWQQVFDTASKTQKRGLNWEVLDQTTASGAPVASIRISKKFRARVTRNGVYMVFISLHPDHDSAYKQAGGENVGSKEDRVVRCFMYGSRMHIGEMKAAAPSATMAFIAKVDGWRLCFPRYSVKRHGGVASIEQCKGETLWGVVWQLPEIELAKLDKKEGVHLNRYRRDQIEVTDTLGKTHRCHIYFAIPERESKPSAQDYMRYIIEGAQQHCLPEEYIEKLQRIPTAPKKD